jgi:NAD(P)-dependent dehydrogenase (short-subunit alcohol dehydrogenase family)
MNTQLFDLTGKVALVTGASRGIGESIAKLLAAQGAHVVISSRRAESCQRVADEIIAAGGSAEVIACHIGEIEQIESLWAQLDARQKKVDIVVNNAAANPYFGPIVDTDYSAFQKTVDVNIRGYFFMSSNAARRMASAGGGTIVNVASVNGVIPGPFQGIYSITKAAVISMTEAFARECAPSGVRVNALLPGLTDTKFAATIVRNDSILSSVLQHVPMNRVAAPNEMAGAVLFLVSDAASYVTGSSLVVDGGYLLA